MIENGVLIKFEGPGGDVVIPKGVTGIGSGAFKGCSSLTNIVLPEGLTGMGDKAFRACRSLSAISLPDRLSTLGRCIFIGCNALKDISASEKVWELAEKSLAFGNRLQGVTVAVTGTLRRYPDRVDFMEIAECFGGRVTCSVSDKTTCLIANDPDSDTDNIARASEMGIPVMSEDEFFQQYFPGVGLN